MKPKKNSKADLKKKSTLFTQIGLIIVLFLAWQAIEWKTYDHQNLDLAGVNVNALLENDVPITKIINTPPVLPPKVELNMPDELKVVDDKMDVEEVLPISFETNQDDILKVQDIENVIIQDDIVEVPFNIIENVPIFPGCEKYDTNEERKACMSSKIREYVNDNFDTGLAQELGLSGRTRINVAFKIDSKGNVVGVKARAPHPRLQQEAIKVIKGLPAMTPGMQRGKAVEVLYSLPIIFEVQ